MPNFNGPGLPSALLMGLSFLGILSGYWTILKHTSLFTGLVTATLAEAQEPLQITPEALNPQLTNIVENETVTIYYNGTGPVPDDDLRSPAPEPITPLNSISLIEDAFFDDLRAIADSVTYSDACSKCIAGVQLLHLAAITQPVSTATNLLIRACHAIPPFQRGVPAATCESEFDEAGGLGPYYAQLLSKMSLATGDMTALCAYHYNVCDESPPIEIDEDLYFTPKPPSADLVPPPSGEAVNVLHLSDWHLDPRYDIGSEANCTNALCCRSHSKNDDLDTDKKNPSVPASRFGSFLCDSPADLALSALSNMADFVDMADLSFSIFTGDIVSHDLDDALSRAYVSYEEEITFEIFKTMLGDTPVYVTLGNHDSLPVAFHTQHSLNPNPRDASTNALAWNYDLVSSLWLQHSWINESEAEFARTHYGAYASTTTQGLRVISINTDFWYRSNIFNFWNVTNPDTSGILKWLADELSDCEARGQRAWIIGHVLSGYDGEAPLPNPTALFYSIVRRFSPATIAGIFFGHTHQDQFQIFYDYLPGSTRLDSSGRTLRDTTQVDYGKPLQMAYIGPSITPLTGLNSGYQIYQVDAKTFSVTGRQTYFANISNSLSWTTPVWEFEYDARTTYADDDDPWPDAAPLNATFWHRLTERMLQNQTLVDLYNTFETKSSISTLRRGGPGSAAQKICFLRSGSGALGNACRTKYGSLNQGRAAFV